MTVQLSRIPLSGTAQTFNIEIKGTTYIMRLVYANVAEGGWVLDISDELSTPIICGIPLVTGTNLLAQCSYLGLRAALLVVTEFDPPAVPTFTNLGSESNLYLVTEI